MRRPKLLFLLLIALGVAFYLVAAVGAFRDGDEKGDDRPGLVSRLEGMFSSRVAVGALRVVRACRLADATIVVLGGRQCTIAVAPARERHRKLVLYLREGVVDSVDFESSRSEAGRMNQQGFSLPIESERLEALPWAGQDPRQGSLTVYKDGGTLSIDCRAQVSRCVLEVRE